MFLKWMMADFPTSTSPNLRETASVQVLWRFSSSLTSTEYPTPNVAPSLHESRKKVELSFRILTILEENAGRFLKKENAFPVIRKKGKADTTNPNIDPLPFDYMGITVPAGPTEANQASVQVLSQLQSILEVGNSTAAELV